MKKLMIFLHGKGACKDDPKYGVIGEIAKRRGYELFAFNAETPHKSGYKWIDKNDKILTKKELDKVVEDVLRVIDEELKKRGIGYDDVIMAGHSQGAFVALMIALVKGAKEVIALTPAFYEFDGIEEFPHWDFPIYWIEGGLDDVVSDKRKNAYKMLQNLGYDVKFILSENSGHDDFSFEILDRI